MKVKNIILFLHRWIGLISGLVVFIVSITGAIFVFEKELFSLFHPSYVKVNVPEKASVLPLSILQANAQHATRQPINIIRVPATADQQEAYIFESLKRRPKNDIVGVFVNKEIIYWDRIFVDPYSGRVLGKIDVETNFFWIVRQIHQFLYLRRDVGSVIVGTSVLLFIITLISGLFLWWPKNRKVAVKRLKIDFSTKWKRLNYDLHQVLGFYAFLVAMVIASTGLVWSFKWWETSIYWFMDGKRPNTKIEEPKHQDSQVTKSPVAPLDLIWSDVVKKYSTHQGVFINLVHDASQANVNIYTKGHTWWSASDAYAYDLRNGRAYYKRLQNDKTLGMKWRNSNYDIHVGKIAGLTGMWIAFVASLICASLPVTGFYIWYGRKFKKKKSRS
ncbi:PepSY domain-containing protein [Sphingobacterium sp. N143]|uniref:PepSY-associated TM helix domain-containing protein n=1 Tax=Sphingobacterium sp. N143 TaxID=2746727 RepID=UPI002576828E|nr:PepSY-associated TM helix domain-containing protein [Sphingobacterium sp. N143]MDM1295276.1 PepSY domain-containing protein [Sphingobacterium sp. N143]